MKYLSLSTVESSFKNSVVKTQIEFWTLLGVLQSIDGELKSGITYKFLMAKTASFLGKIFTLSDNYSGISDSEEWYAKFGTQWTKEISTFVKQGKVANIYELAIWALRKEEFEDNADINTVLQIFANRFHISLETLTNLFSHDNVTCDFETALYSDTDLKDFIKTTYPQDNDFDNLRPDGKLIVNSADAVQAGAFVKPFFNKLYNNRCLMTTMFNVDLVYSGKSTNSITQKDLPLQKIVYGAPGTGKSFGTDDKIKEIYPSKEKQKENVFRTTFHPDSDYSTFVGAYKPTKNLSQKLLGKEELVSKCKEYATRTGYSNQNLTQFGYDFSLSLQKITKEDKTFSYANFLAEAGVTDTSASSYVTAGMDLYSKTASKIANITY